MKTLHPFQKWHNETPYIDPLNAQTAEKERELAWNAAINYAEKVIQDRVNKNFSAAQVRT